MTGTTPRPASAVRRARARGSFRAGSLLVLIFCTSLGALLGASPASAGSSAGGIASNAWIVSDLAAQAVTAGSTMPYDPVLEAELLAAGAATTTTAGAGTVQAKPKAGGKLGLILNTVGMLGGLALMWPGGDDAPAVPGPAAGGQYQDYGCGYVERIGVGITITNVTCQSPSGTNRVMWRKTGTVTSLYVRNPATSAWEAKLHCGTTCSASADVAADVYAWLAQYGPDLLIEWRNASSIANTSVAGSYSVVGKFYPEAVGASVAPPVTDPALVPRYIDSSATCKTSDGLGGFTSQTITNRVGPFTFDPAQPSELPEAPDLECPAGSFLSGGSRVLATEGSTETVPLTEPYTAPTWVEEQVTRFPECLPVGGQACQLQLFRKASPKFGEELNCNSIGAGSDHACRDWFTDPNKSENYECRYGANVLPLRNCEPYKQTFSTGTLTTTPDTETAPPPIGADPTPEQTPNLGTCVPGWAELLTPWWAYKAVGCAMKWAFVPETALADRVDGIKTLLLTKAPFSWFSGFLSIPGAIPDVGCPDWRVKVAGLDRSVVCGHESTEFIRDARPVLTVFMCALALWPLVRSTAYAAFPIIKPQPGMLR